MPAFRYRKTLGMTALVVTLVAPAAAHGQILSINHGRSLTDEDTLRVTVMLKTGEAIEGIEVAAIAPPGFTIEPQSISISKLAGSTVRAFNVKAAAKKPHTGAYTIPVHLSAKKGADLLSEVQTGPFDFKNTDIKLRTYLLFGAIGIVVGYWLRLFIKILTAVTPDSPLVATQAADGPVTTFVKQHYYLVDSIVTLVLGVAALISLAGADTPPTFAARWHTSLLAGITLGLLTNSDMVTKLGARLPARI